MKGLFSLMLIFFTACTGTDDKVTTVGKSSEVILLPENVNNAEASKKIKAIADSIPLSKVYSNARFKNVTVKKTGDNKYLISGKGQIFEANFNWVIEDGHNELKKGFTMTDAGAPEWGNFSFEIAVKKERPNSTLTLILFEASAEDGRPTHQLPIPLY